MNCLAGVFKVNFLLEEDTKIMENLVNFLSKRINHSVDIVNLCVMLQKLKIISN